MSALSEQCEALRLWANHLREGEPILASDLREAADTILNLRDMAQQAQSEKAALERRIDELCAEVEQGKAEFKKMDAWHSQELKAAMDENAKLRELASILCFCMQVHAQCDDCKLNGAKGELAHDPLCACDGLHEILRELGIEVPS